MVNLGSIRRMAFLGSSALTLCLTAPAQAGIRDWWDIFSGMAEIETQRIERQADLDFSWSYARRLHAVRQLLELKIRRLKSPQIDALLENLDDQDTHLDDLRLPHPRIEAAFLTEVETREALGLPAQGLRAEGLAIKRHNNVMVIYYEELTIGRVTTADSVRTVLYNDIKYNPPVSSSRVTTANQIAQHIPWHIEGGRMTQFYRGTQDLHDELKDLLPETAVIGLRSGTRPRTTRITKRLRDCPAGKVGEGVFQTFEYYNLDGDESEDGIEPFKDFPEHEKCQPKPPEDEAEFVWKYRGSCATQYAAWHAGLMAREGAADVDAVTGRYVERRKAWTHTRTFPASWLLDPLVLTWNDPWEIKTNTCQVAWRTRDVEPGPAGAASLNGQICEQQRTRRRAWNWISWPASDVNPAGRTRKAATHVTYPDLGRPGYAHGGWVNGAISNCHAKPQPPRPTPQPTRGGRDRDRGNDGQRSIDVDGDGIGDYRSSYESERAGHGRGTAVRDHCGNCNGPKKSGDKRGGGRDRGSSGGGNGGGNSRVICTELWRQGLVSRDLAVMDLRFTAEHLTPAHYRGYHAWAIPVVQRMRQSARWTAVWKVLAVARMNEIAWQLGRAERPDYLGKIVRHTLEPLSWLIGQFVGESNITALDRTARNAPDVDFTTTAGSVGRQKRHSRTGVETC